MAKWIVLATKAGDVTLQPDRPDVWGMYRRTPAEARDLAAQLLAAAEKLEPSPSGTGAESDMRKP